MEPPGSRMYDVPNLHFLVHQRVADRVQIDDFAIASRELRRICTLGLCRFDARPQRGP